MNLLDTLMQARDALEAASAFISNGVALGYIRMPDADCPDPAHGTPLKIDDAITALTQAIEKMEKVEPVAWLLDSATPITGTAPVAFKQSAYFNIPLYTHPAPAVEKVWQVDKYKSCGCVLCTCENEDQCQGCGAKYCETHRSPTPAAPKPEEVK